MILHSFKQFNTVRLDIQSIELFLSSAVVEFGNIAFFPSSEYDKKLVKQKGKKISIKKYDLFSLNEELQMKILGSVIKLLNNLDYPPRSRKILTALKFLNSTKDVKHQLGGCQLKSKNNYLYVEKTL